AEVEEPVQEAVDLPDGRTADPAAHVPGPPGGDERALARHRHRDAAAAQAPRGRERAAVGGHGQQERSARHRHARSQETNTATPWLDTGGIGACTLRRSEYLPTTATPLATVYPRLAIRSVLLRAKNGSAGS